MATADPSHPDALSMLGDALGGRALGGLDDAGRRSLLVRLIDSGKVELRSITQHLIDKVYGLSRWFGLFKGNVVARLRAATYGVLGVTRLPTPDREEMERLIGLQDGWARKFRNALKSGRQPLDGTALSRSGMYADAAWSVAYTVQRAAMERAGRTLIRRVRAVTDSCAGCIAEAKKGWRPIGEPLPNGIADLGTQQCYGACRCLLQYQ